MKIKLRSFQQESLKKCIDLIIKIRENISISELAALKRVQRQLANNKLKEVEDEATKDEQ